MLNNHEVYYTAMKSRDARFDGRFFVGVHTTGIYCRPVCPAPNPKSENVSFYPTAAAAKRAGFRPCLRCLPESSPGTPEWDAASTAISQALRLISAGYLNEKTVDELADELYISARQLRRLFEDHLGASPNDVAQTQRLHFAKKLINETNLSMAEVAFSAGFSSVRRFNAVINQTYGRSPLSLRATKKGAGVAEDDFLQLSLAYRPPYDWDTILQFLQARLIPGVEEVTEGGYARTVQVGEAIGVIKVQPHAKKDMLLLQASPNLAQCLFTLVERVKRIFDLKAYPDEITQHLAKDDALATIVGLKPGLRLPGAWDGFELTVRAILGQQVSVKAANTLAGRIVAAFGQPLAAPTASGLTAAFPTPASLAEAKLDELGITGQRVRAINAVSTAVAAGRLTFEGLTPPEETVAALQSIPGIGDWTAQYVAMRVLGDPDAFPAGDLGLRKAISNGQDMIGIADLRKRAETWRPWRSYAAIYLWASLAGE